MHAGFALRTRRHPRGETLLAHPLGVLPFRQIFDLTHGKFRMRDSDTPQVKTWRTRLRPWFAAAAIFLGGLSHAALVQPLDTSGRFQIEVGLNSQGQVVAHLTARSGTWKNVDPTFTQTMKEGLSVDMGGTRVPVTMTAVDASVEALTPLPPKYENLAIKLYDHTLAALSYVKAEKAFRPAQAATPLTLYDLRRFGLQGKAYLKDWKPYVATPQAAKLSSHLDLHTHYAGAPTSDTILKLGQRYKTPYPAAYLDRLGIRYPAAALVKDARGRAAVALSPELMQSAEWLASDGSTKLRNALEIDPTSIRTMNGMSDVYKYREPFLKDPKLFAPFLEELAHEYQKMGIDYVELSAGDVLWPSKLQDAQKILPRIEKMTGVKIRFLAALRRTSPTLHNLDMLEIVKALARSPYVVGIDVMGHETNSTRAFTDVIRRAAEVGKEVNPNFQVRIHAGENPLHPENIREAIEAGATRIGHGIYGDLDEATIAKAIAKGVVIEANPISNQALNNLGDVERVARTFKKYLDSGLRVTMSTDGHGIYGGGPQELREMLTQLGFDEADFAKIQKSDRAYVQMMEKVFKQKFAANGIHVPQEMPDPQFTQADFAELTRQGVAKTDNLVAAMKGKGINVHGVDELGHAFEGMRPVLFSGASRSSWPLISPANQAEVAATIGRGLDLLDPKKAYIVTGATEFGVEKIVHAEAVKRGFRILGTVVSDARPAEIGPLTDAAVMGQAWFDKSSKLMQHIKDQKGLVLFVGGGNIVNDEIQAAKNFGLDFHLMTGPEGAAHEFAKLMPERAFNGSRGLGNVLFRRMESALRSDQARAARDDMFFEYAKNLKAPQQVSYEQLLGQARAPGRKVIVLGGYSGLGYENPQVLKDHLRELMRQAGDNVMYVIGGTEDGIGEAYRWIPELRRELGLKRVVSSGIVSRNAAKYGVSSFADYIHFVDTDVNAWDVLRDGQSLMVDIADRTKGRMVYFKGGAVSKAEISEALAKRVAVDLVTDRRLTPIPKKVAERLAKDPHFVADETRGFVLEAPNYLTLKLKGHFHRPSTRSCFNSLFGRANR